MITKKTLAFFIATGLAMGTLSNASYAINQVEGLNMVVMEEEEAINTFSYEELLDLAMKNSSTLIRQQKQIERSEIMREEAAKNKTYTPAGTLHTPEEAAAGAALQGLIAADTELAMAKRQLDIEKDKIAYNVKRDFDSLIVTTKQLALDKTEKEIAEIELKIGNIQYQQGLISQNELNMLKDNYQEALNKVGISEAELENAFLKLNDTVGIDKNTKYHVRIDAIEETKEIPVLETHIRKILSNSPSIWMLEQRLKLVDLSLDLYTYNVGQDPYKAKEIDADISKMTLQDTKQVIELSLRNLYHSLEKLQESIKLLEINREKTQRNVELSRLKLEVGMTTPLEVKKLEKVLKELDKQILQLKLQFEETLMMYEKPWVISN